MVAVLWMRFLHTPGCPGRIACAPFYRAFQYQADQRVGGIENSCRSIFTREIWLRVKINSSRRE